MSDLDNFLRSLGQAESQGTFTLDPGQALRSLGEHLFPEPGLWAVKLVQGAVAQKAAGVSFSLERSRFKFRCRGLQNPSASRLLSALLNPQLSSPPELAHWLSGLRAAIALEPRELVVDSRDGESNESLRWKGDNFTSGQKWTGLKPGELRITMEVKTAWLRSAFADEHSQISTRCRFAPIPVELDVHGISPHWTPYRILQGLQGGSTEQEPTFGCLLAGSPPRAILRPRLPLKVDERSLGESRSFDLRVLIGLRDRSPKFLESLGAKSPALLYWVRDGALLGPYRLGDLRSMWSIEVFCPADHLKLDISEFAVIDPQDRLPRKAIRQAAAMLLPHLHGNAPREWEYPIEQARVALDALQSPFSIAPL